MKKFFYRVQNGQTIMSISQKLSLPQALLIKENKLREEVSEGDLLYIEVEEDKIYKVKANDTIEGIARKFRVTKEELLAKNGVPFVFYGLNIKI